MSKRKMTTIQTERLKTAIEKNKELTMNTDKIVTLTSARRAIHSTWRAYDSAETIKHIADGHQDLDSILRFSTELVLRLEVALQDAKTLEGIARRDVEQKNEASRIHAAMLQEIA